MASLSRTKHKAVTCGEIILMWDGINSDHSLPSSEAMLYSIDTQRWLPRRTNGEVPPGMSSAVAAVQEDTMYVVGGLRNKLIGIESEKLGTSPTKRKWQFFELPDPA